MHKPAPSPQPPLSFAPREAELIPYGATERLPARAVLVIAPHADDEVFGCGGAVARHVDDGIPVTVLILTDGAQAGDSGTRHAESAAAAHLMGYPPPLCWNQPDRGLRCTPELVERLRALIQDLRIDLVYAPSPWELHPDHRQAANLALQAARGLDIRVALYELSAPLVPNVLLDITPWIAQKAAAMQCFGSQNARQDYPAQVQALNRYRSYTLPQTVLAAEAYLVMDAVTLERFLREGTGAGLAAPVRDGQPRVSILIRSMDRPTLSEALDSVALQTYPHIDVVVVAAHAEHSSLPERCGPFPVRLVPADAPRSRSQAANVALKEATGELLLLLDDDDWLMPGHVARLVDVMRGQPHAIAAYASVSVVDARGFPLGRVLDEPSFAALFRPGRGHDALLFDESLDQETEQDFWARMAHMGHLVHLPGVSAAHRVNHEAPKRQEPEQASPSELEILRAELQAMRQSTIWRWTAGLRQLVQWLRG